MGKGRAQREGDSAAIGGPSGRESTRAGGSRADRPSTRGRRRGPREEERQRRAAAEVGMGLRPKEGVEDGKGEWRGRAKTQRGRHGRQKKAGAERSIRRSREVCSQLRSTPAARRPVTRAVVVGSIPTSSARGAHLKTSLVQGSWRRYSCNRSSRGHIGTEAPPDTGGEQRE